MLMATAELLNDNLQIDGFNSYTWSKTFGVPSDGTYVDGSYISQIDESSTTSDSDDFQTFQPPGMYLKTASTDPAPDMMFPARKYEHDDGRVTYERTPLVMTRAAYDSKVWMLFFLLSAVTFFYILSKAIK